MGLWTCLDRSLRHDRSGRLAAVVCSRRWRGTRFMVDAAPHQFQLVIGLLCSSSDRHGAGNYRRSPDHHRLADSYDLATLPHHIAALCALRSMGSVCTSAQHGDLPT